MNSSRASTSLLNFFIFNPSFGPREGDEDKKIVYYYPNDIDIDTKIKDVGLCEAIVKFTETFTDKPCNSVHTQKRRQLLYSPEEEFWIVMTIRIPSSEKVKDGETITEYHEEDIQDSVYEEVLKHSYRMFKLFMGNFNSILEKGTVQNLKQRCEHFFSRYLLTLRLQYADVLDIFNGIYFLPLDKTTYLKIQCFVNLIEATFSQVRYTAFLYNDQLVWSGLEQEDMCTLYKYLTTSLFPSYLDQELQGGQPSPSAPPSSAATHYGRFITGPVNLHDNQNQGKVPKVYINADVENVECHLLVYRAMSATVCVLVDATYQLTLEFYRKLDAFLGPKLSELASTISDQYSKRQNSGENQFKYIYFNHMNLAQKTTVHQDGRKSHNQSSVNVPPEILNLLGDMNDDFRRWKEDGEIIVKTASEYWVVGKKSDQREFYVIILQKNANLIEISEEVKRLCSTSFNNIFFLD